jgi:hypothetical protein
MSSKKARTALIAQDGVFLFNFIVFLFIFACFSQMAYSSRASKLSLALKSNEMHQTPAIATKV